MENKYWLFNKWSRARYSPEGRIDPVSMRKPATLRMSQYSFDQVSILSNGSIDSEKTHLR